jgi:hypothetical protein
MGHEAVRVAEIVRQAPTESASLRKEGGHEGGRALRDRAA